MGLIIESPALKAREFPKPMQPHSRGEEAEETVPPTRNAKRKPTGTQGAVTTSHARNPCFGDLITGKPGFHRPMCERLHQAITTQHICQVGETGARGDGTPSEALMVQAMGFCTERREESSGRMADGSGQSTGSSCPSAPAPRES